MLLSRSGVVLMAALTPAVGVQAVEVVLEDGVLLRYL